MRRIFVLVFMLSCASFASAQTTNVTATITDSDAIAWANGNFTVTFIPNPSFSGPYKYQGVNFVPQTYTGTMDASGHMAITIPDNNFISPAGTQWTFVLQSNTSAPASQITTIVTGASANFTTLFSTGVTAPRFSATAGAFGYSTVEVKQTPQPGGSFYNVTASCVEVWSGTSFSCNGGGGGGSFGGLTGGTNTTATMVVGTGASLGTSGLGTITATGVPWGGISALPANCASGQFMTGVASVTLPCSAVNFSQLVGTIAAAQVPGGTGCPANQYALGLNAALALACAQISYAQISGTPTLGYQTLFVNGTAQTQRPNWNLINGANCTFSNVDNGVANRSDITLTCTGGGGGSAAGPKGTFQMVGSSPGSFDLAPMNLDVLGILRTTNNSLTCGPEPNVNIYCFGAFITFTSTTGSITAGANTLVIPGPGSFKTGEYLIAAGAGATSSIATPTAVIIVPEVNGGGDHGVPQTGGTSPYGVCIVAVGNDNQASPCSAITTISTAQASLGMQVATVSAKSRSNNVVTVSCSSACDMPTGTNAYLNYFGDSDTAMAGWFIVTRIDSTHFSFNGKLDTRAGAPTAPTSLSGPTVTWFQINRYGWSAVAGAKYYEVYAGPSCSTTPSTCSLVGYADPGRLFYDDYGTTMEANKTFHPWTPSTGPATARNGNLSCKIGAGGGTTNLTLVTPAGANCNAGNTVSGALVESDDGPALVAAVKNAGLINTVGGPIVYIPSPPVACFACIPTVQPQITSYTDLSAVPNIVHLTLQLGSNSVTLRDTLVLPNGTHIYGSSDLNSSASFAWGSYPALGTNGEAYPAILLAGGGNSTVVMDHLLLFNGAQNGGLTIFGENVINSTFDNLYWTSGGTQNDYKNLHGLFLVAGNGAASFNNIFSKSTFTTGQPGGGISGSTIGRSPVPSFIYEGLSGACTPGNTIIKSIWTLYRGSFDFDVETSTCGGMNIILEDINAQDNFEPSIQETGGNALAESFNLTASRFACYDLATACFNYYSSLPQAGSTTILGNITANTGSYPALMGLLNLDITGDPGSMNQNQNVDIEFTKCGGILDGTFGTNLSNIPASACQKAINENVSIGVGQNIFTPRATLPAPIISCSTSSGTVFPATYQFLVAVAEPMGGEGAKTFFSSPCTLASPGNIQIDWSAAAAAAPGAAGFELYFSTGGGTHVVHFNTVPGFPPTTTSYNYNSNGDFVGGSTPSLPASAGANGFNLRGVFGTTVQAGYVPPGACGSGSGTVPGCIAQQQSNLVAPGAAGFETRHFNTAGVEVCTNNGGVEAPCVSGGGGGTTSAAVIPPVPSYSVLTPQLVYNTPSASVNANISATPMVAFTNTIHQYKFEWLVSLTTPGTSCTGTTTVVLNAVFTNPSNATPVTQSLGTITLATNSNGTAGFISSGVAPVLAAPGTPVQYSTSSFTAGTGCSPAPKYQVQATLLQEF